MWTSLYAVPRDGKRFLGFATLLSEVEKAGYHRALHYAYAEEMAVSLHLMEPKFQHILDDELAKARKSHPESTDKYYERITPWPGWEAVATELEKEIRRTRRLEKSHMRTLPKVISRTIDKTAQKVHVRPQQIEDWLQLLRTRYRTVRTPLFELIRRREWDKLAAFLAQSEENLKGIMKDPGKRLTYTDPDSLHTNSDTEVQYTDINGESLDLGIDPDPESESVLPRLNAIRFLKNYYFESLEQQYHTTEYLDYKIKAPVQPRYGYGAAEAGSFGPPLFQTRSLSQLHCRSSPYAHPTSSRHIAKLSYQKTIERLPRFTIFAYDKHHVPHDIRNKSFEALASLKKQSS